MPFMEKDDTIYKYEGFTKLGFKEKLNLQAFTFLQIFIVTKLLVWLHKYVPRKGI